ncbi:DUF3169 family protein [Oceanobacillus timonensis]|uniref:DUF3169 family protein n=1 Tax=Oceanobacillus timonensis TaxID=1926285 RepID=UPI0009BB46FD|nr:DUF3169 family protein [Oceanobacillus timonensis]
MKAILSTIFSGIIGFTVMYSLLHFSDWSFAGEFIVIGLLVISIIFIGISFIRFHKIKSFSKQHFSGNEEDVMEEKKSKMFTDYTLFTFASFALSILALSLNLMLMQYVILTVLSIILLIASYLTNTKTRKLVRYLNPDRDFSTTSKSASTEELLDLYDDGEKHVALKGLFQAHTLLNATLILAITLSTAYSIILESSQVFSVILMAVILLIVNSKYLLVVRKY